MIPHMGDTRTDSYYLLLSIVRYSYIEYIFTILELETDENYVRMCSSIEIITTEDIVHRTLLLDSYCFYIVPSKENIGDIIMELIS